MVSDEKLTMLILIMQLFYSNDVKPMTAAEGLRPYTDGDLQDQAVSSLNSTVH